MLLAFHESENLKFDLNVNLLRQRLGAYVPVPVHVCPWTWHETGCSPGSCCIPGEQQVPPPTRIILKQESSLVQNA